MRPTRWAIVAGVFVVAAAGGAVAVWLMRRPADTSDQPAPGSMRARQPAVAGLFYRADGNALSSQVDGFLANAAANRVEQIRAIICPHAGYSYSGQTAAEGFKQLAGRGFRTAVVLAPSHTARFQGASIPKVGAYETPLGRIRLSPKAAHLAKLPPFVWNPAAEVSRPPWWRQASKDLPAFGQDTPHTWEHSLEVELPFLQKVLGDFELVPIVFGEVEPLAVAKALIEHVLDDKTVFVASSDLSHHYAYDEARALDERCVQAILDLRIDEMPLHEACGRGPILALMHMARLKGWRAKLLATCNSGDTSGNKASVVGYAAIAFHEADQQAQPNAQTRPAKEKAVYDAAERKRLLELARRTLVGVVTNRNLPDVDPNDYAGKLSEKKGCFVTLTVGGQLRGCIGHIAPQEPLYSAVMHNAQNAALHDKRFSPVEKNELEKINVEVSVLTVPQRLSCDSPAEMLARLRPGVDGVVLQVGSQQSTYLPQVWEQMPSRLIFLSMLARKAGLPQAVWRSPQAAVWTYQAEAFAEGEGEAHPAH
ncbi:MAG TPA: AmmeMemoRadiSam system protein B [Phycisphaerae bacterium]|nr:AmmeMemoRadiSam system protein B [Phycisphaerae bacterium]